MESRIVKVAASSMATMKLLIYVSACSRLQRDLDAR